MIGTSIVQALVTAGMTASNAAVYAVLTDTDPLLVTVSKAVGKATGKAPAARQVRFQARCVAHGMPTTHAGHECTRAHGNALVCAATVNGTGHTLYVDGKPAQARMVNGQRTVSNGKVGQYASKAAVTAAYCIARDVDYVIHNKQCTPAHVNARQAMLDGRCGGHTGKVIKATR